MYNLHRILSYFEPQFIMLSSYMAVVPSLSAASGAEEVMKYVKGVFPRLHDVGEQSTGDGYPTCAEAAEFVAKHHQVQYSVEDATKKMQNILLGFRLYHRYNKKLLEVERKLRESSSSKIDDSVLAKAIVDDGSVFQNEDETHTAPTIAKLMLLKAPDDDVLVCESMLRSRFVGDADEPPSMKSTIQFAPVKEELEMSGYLLKLGGMRKNWKVRYFVISDGVLEYYTDDTQLKVKGKEKGSLSLLSPNLKFAVADETDPHPDLETEKATGYQGFAFKIITPERNYIFCAKTNRDSSNWLQALRRTYLWLQRKEDTAYHDSVKY